MKIVIDTMGADYSPAELVLGAVDAINACGGFSVVLFGCENEINASLSNIKYDKSRVEVFDCSEVITNEDVPTEAVLSKKQSSLVRALNFLNENTDAKGFVSAGSTGAVLTGALLLLKRIRGINRPALSPLLPTVDGDKQVLLIDCGANVDPKPQNLVQFAVMGSVFMKCVKGIDSPRVALLSNGAEDAKGSPLNKEAFPLIKASGVNFIGNIEGRDMLSGDADVVVADGYSGNIALKTCEGTALSMFEIIKKGIMSGGLRSKIGYLLLKPVLKKVKKTLDYNDNGGAVLLGLEKVIVKSHGSSKRRAIMNSVLQAKNMAGSGIIESVAAEMSPRT